MLDNRRELKQLVLVYKWHLSNGCAHIPTSKELTQYTGFNTFYDPLCVGASMAAEKEKIATNVMICYFCLFNKNKNPDKEFICVKGKYRENHDSIKKADTPEKMAEALLERVKILERLYILRNTQSENIN